MALPDVYFLKASQLREVLLDREWHSNAIQSIAVAFEHGARRWRLDDLTDLWPELNPAPTLGADWLTRFKRRAELDRENLQGLGQVFKRQEKPSTPGKPGTSDVAA